MENHPIPQDITGFQFKLIGNMTVKQFAYLAVGVVLGWITFAMPISLLLKIPLGSLFAGIGAGFAFLPIDGRPLDIMIGNFVKVLSNPTQYVYQKMGANLYFPEYTQRMQTATTTATPTQNAISSDKLKTFLSSLPSKPKNKLDEREISFLQTLSSMSTPTTIPHQSASLHLGLPSFGSLFKGQQSQQQDSQPVQVTPPQPIDKPVDNNDEDQVLQKQTEAIKNQLENAKKLEAAKSQGSKEQEEAHQKVMSLENLLNETMHQKQLLENQLIELQKKIEQQNKTVYSPSMATPEPKMQQTKRVRSIPREMGKSVGLPIASEFPNVITGIVKDPRNNPLPGILVEVKDEGGSPIRAFKTNPLGQFASATPLSNGTYTIDFEDPSKKNKFDTIEFTAKGEIILPLEVISADEREELRKSLFG
jgi:hypothetical protein